VSDVLDFLTPVVSRGIVHVRRSPIRLQDWVRVSSCYSSRNGLPRTSQPPRWYALSISEQLPSSFESKYLVMHEGGNREERVCVALTYNVERSSSAKPFEDALDGRSLR
jgi:hypothetical protein